MEVDEDRIEEVDTMAQQALPPRSVHSTPAHWDRPRPAPVLSLHGEDPTSGIPATWHVTRSDDEADDTYVIEHAEGDIHSPQLWMQARRDASVASEADVIELLRSVVFGR